MRIFFFLFFVVLIHFLVCFSTNVIGPIHDYSSWSFLTIWLSALVEQQNVRSYFPNTDRREFAGFNYVKLSAFKRIRNGIELPLFALVWFLTFRCSNNLTVFLLKNILATTALPAGLCIRYEKSRIIFTSSFSAWTSCGWRGLTLTFLNASVQISLLLVAFMLLLIIVTTLGSQAWSPFIFGVDGSFSEKAAAHKKSGGSLDSSVS